MQNPEFAAGYWEQDAEIQFMRALDVIRQSEHMSMTQLARNAGKSRESLARLFNAENPNPTLDTITDLLRTLHLQAEVTLRRVPEGTPPLAIKEPA